MLNNGRMMPLTICEYTVIGQEKDISWFINHYKTSNNPNYKYHNPYRISYGRHDTDWNFESSSPINISRAYPNLYFFFSAACEDSKRIRIICKDGNKLTKSNLEHFRYKDDDLGWSLEYKEMLLWQDKYIDRANHDEWVFLYSLENNFDWNTFGGN
jgi:hypothetical protein